ncbi:hypothetical protein GCM10027592_24800 [Spirosoma flavus]
MGNKLNNVMNRDEQVEKDEPNGKADVLVSEKTENVKPTGVDDNSTGMGEDDYLAKSNKENDED